MTEPLNQKILQEALNYNPLTGDFTWKTKISRKVNIGQEAGCPMPSGYKKITIFGRQCLAHRLAFLYMTGTWPQGQIDHIDGNTSNNVWINLRDCSPRENSCNTSLRKDNTSGIKGVSLHKRTGMWTVHIYINGRDTNLGYFKDKTEAQEVITTAREQYHGEYARHY